LDNFQSWTHNLRKLLKVPTEILFSTLWGYFPAGIGDAAIIHTPLPPLIIKNVILTLL
jgi:hypothetical protein